MIKCLICGKEFKQLNGHLIKHNITPKEYCEKFKVESTYSDEARDAASKATKKGMNEEVITKMKNNWLSPERKKFLERRSAQMMGNIPANRLTNEQFLEKLNSLFPNQFELLSDYKGANANITLRCKVCEQVIEKRPNYLYEYGCPSCKKLNKKPRVNTWNQISSQEFRDNFNKLVGDEYTLLSDYTKAEDYIKIKHNECGHVWDVKARQFYSTGSRCPLCAKKVSNAEKELYSFVSNTYDGEIQNNVRNIIPPYELDIYIPDKNVAIEFNGTYWHSSLYKDADYHYNKSSACEEKGIRLIHIWEYEWINERQRPILENIIKSALGVIEEKIPARKCNVVIKESSEMREFFDKNNIQGFRPGKFAICLEYNNEIVMSYMMGSAFFGKGKYEWEVIRGATKLGTTVVGGASKLWKYFIDNYEPKSCVYYIDYNYFNGNSVEKLGLKYVSSQSSYKNYWVEYNVIKNREPQRHKEIKELEKQGLVIPIYNAGTKVYLYER